VGKTEAVFSALPKKKDPGAFTRDDLPLLFTADEAQRLARPFLQKHPNRKCGPISLRRTLKVLNCPVSVIYQDDHVGSIVFKTRIVVGLVPSLLKCNECVSEVRDG